MCVIQVFSDRSQSPEMFPRIFPHLGICKRWQVSFLIKKNVIKACARLNSLWPSSPPSHSICTIYWFQSWLGGYDSFWFTLSRPLHACHLCYSKQKTQKPKSSLLIIPKSTGWFPTTLGQNTNWSKWKQYLQERGVCVCVLKKQSEKDYLHYIFLLAKERHCRPFHYLQGKAMLKLLYYNQRRKLEV